MLLCRININETGGLEFGQKRSRPAGDQYRTIGLALYELITLAEPYISAKYISS